MLAAQTRRFHFARRPVEPFGQPQPPRAGHGAQGRKLFGTGLLIRQHEIIMRQKNILCKLPVQQPMAQLILDFTSG